MGKRRGRRRKQREKNLAQQNVGLDSRNEESGCKAVSSGKDVGKLDNSAEGSQTSFTLGTEKDSAQKDSAQEISAQKSSDKNLGNIGLQDVGSKEGFNFMKDKNKSFDSKPDEQKVKSADKAEKISKQEDISQSADPDTFKSVFDESSVAEEPPVTEDINVKEEPKIMSVKEDNRDYGKEPMGARIKVIGIGGGGGNAVNNMIESGLSGVEFMVANTDAQALVSSQASNKIQLGNELTKGLGAGAEPDIGQASARESIEDLKKELEGADMVFITAGMGGGTGSGGAPVIASVAKELGALTVGVVTKPFLFEGKRRMNNAETGIDDLKREVDTLITIPNQRLLSVAGRSTTLIDTFRQADDVLFQAVKGISDLILFEGLINVDFADVKAVMSEMGMAMMGSGEAGGENRALEAAEKAISSPLLEDISIHGARGILINVTAGPDVTLQEVNEAADLIHSEAHDDANIIWGMVIDPEIGDLVRVTVIATGFGESAHKVSTVRDRSLAGRIDTSSDEKTLDIPTIVRHKKEDAAEVRLKKISVISSNGDDDKYEIPTFLRRQAD